MPRLSAAAIRTHLPVTPVPGVPEIRLHLADAHSRLGRLPGQAAGPPYWAHVWGGGLVLARDLLDRPGVVAGRRVLDLGCGSGLVGIAAARAGAASVLALDSDPRAALATRVNAALNGVAVTVRRADPLDGPVPPVDVILAGDVFYDPDLARRMTAFLERCVAGGRDVRVGDPGRAPLPRQRLVRLTSMRMADFGVPRAVVPAAVYGFGRPVQGRAGEGLGNVTLPGSASA